MNDEIKSKQNNKDVEQTSAVQNGDISTVGYEDDAHWMQQAIAQANLSGLDVPVGSVLVYSAEIIARGHNQRETNADPTGHAEIVVLRNAATALGRWRLSGTTLYTTLEPCPMCAEAIIQARVSRIVFGAYDPISGATGSAFNLFVPGRIYPLPEIIGGILEDKCQKLLVDFFQNKPQR